MLGIGMGSTDFLATALERGRSVEMYETRENDAQQQALRKQADSAFRTAFNKGLFQVCLILLPYVQMVCHSPRDPHFLTLGDHSLRQQLGGVRALVHNPTTAVGRTLERINNADYPCAYVWFLSPRHCASRTRGSSYFLQP